MKIGILFLGNLNIFAGSLLRVTGLTSFLRELGVNPFFFNEYDLPAELNKKVDYIKLEKHLSILLSILCVTSPLLRYLSKKIFFKEIIRKIKSKSLSALHCHGHPAAALGIVLKEEIQIPIIFDIHGIVALQEKESTHGILNKIVYSKYLKAEQILFQKADFINVRSLAEKEWIRKKYLIGGENIIISPDGVMVPHQSTLLGEKEIIEFRNRIGTPKNKIILFLGALKWISGVQDLVKAYEIVKRKHPETILVIIGRKDYSFHEIEEYIMSNKIDDIIFTGYLPYEDAIRFQKCSDIIVIPETDSTYNHLDPPLKTLEAMAMGIPMVCTKLRCYQSFLINNENAILVNPDSPSDMAEGINKLLEDSVLAKQISEKVLHSIPPDRMWKNISKKLVVEYKKRLTSIIN